MALRTKSAAGANEVEDISTIICAIKSKSEAGLKITTSFKEKFGCQIIDARPRSGGSRGTHYDFEVKVEVKPGLFVWRRIEHKGSSQNRPISPDEKPWTAGVQFHNGGCEKYSIAKKYSKAWYSMYIETGLLKDTFKIESATPSYDEWFDKDCKTQGPPKTPFGLELKRRVREIRGPKASLLEERDPVLSSFIITEEDKNLFKKEVLPIVIEALEQKDYWLTIHGDLNGEFHVAWYPKLVISCINDIVITKKKDIEFKFLCENNFVFNGILRWGMGAGFSNIRIDLK